MAEEVTSWELNVPCLIFTQLPPKGLWDATIPIALSPCFLGRLFQRFTWQFNFINALFLLGPYRSCICSLCGEWNCSLYMDRAPQQVRGQGVCTIISGIMKQRALNTKLVLTTYCFHSCQNVAERLVSYLLQNFRGRD